MNFKKELDTTLKAAEAAAKIIREYASDQSFEIDLKRKNDLVTDADLASEKKIIEIIKAEFPEDQFLAEESNTYTELPPGRVWIIDPIDGTTNFSHGFPPYCVSIAFWEDGIAKVGLVLEVANDECFWAVEGEGAYLGETKLSVSEITDPSKALIATGFPYSHFELVDPYLQVLKNMMQKTHGVRRAGAASYDLCCVAAGRVEGFYEYGLNPWDIAAGMLIIKEAGGISTDWKGEQNQLFGKRIITGNSFICKFLQKQLEACFDEEELEIKK
ncbi:MAG: inositol monophosphatase family protein [Balneolaceae bacterium]